MENCLSGLNKQCHAEEENKPQISLYLLNPDSFPEPSADLPLSILFLSSLPEMCQDKYAGSVSAIWESQIHRLALHLEKYN